MRKLSGCLALLCLGAFIGCQLPAGGLKDAGVTYEPYVAPVDSSGTTATARRTDYTGYLPDTNQLELLPERIVRLNFHILNTTDTLYDFYGEKATRYIGELLYNTNVKFRDNPKAWLTPDTLPVPNLPARIRVDLAEDPKTGAPAIYEHYDDELYWYLHDGPERNRGGRAVIDKYAVRTDTELNIFLMGPPRDSLDSPTFKGSSSSGIFVGNAIKVVDVLSKDIPPWQIRQVFAHELGHAFGLGHAWEKRDGCPDTPPHGNRAWSMRKRGPGLSSNNLMDYSPDQEALTPCQIGKMHARFSTPGYRARMWIREDWCIYNAEDPIVIAEDLTLHGARDFDSDLIVQAGVTLTINDRLHLPEGAEIRVAPNARLVLGAKALLHNDCGGNWAGITIGRAPDGRVGKVELLPGARLQNQLP